MRQSGASYCGALDRLALEIANVLVGNPGNTAALEITLGQCVIEFSQRPRVCVNRRCAMPRLMAKRSDRLATAGSRTTFNA